MAQQLKAFATLSEGMGSIFRTQIDGSQSSVTPVPGNLMHVYICAGKNKHKINFRNPILVLDR